MRRLTFCCGVLALVVGAAPCLAGPRIDEISRQDFPRLLASIGGQQPPTPILGDDYPTRDGTCVRDYVHVVDLARAHLLAVQALREGRDIPPALNLGNGEGFTVREVCDAVERSAGRRPPTVAAPRREGDPATLVASADLAKQALGWEPRHSSLDQIVGTAWDWHRSNPLGYAKEDGAG